MVKYQSNTKINRNKAIVTYKDENPNLSWKEIGEVFGISGARANKIYLKEKAKEGGNG